MADPEKDEEIIELTEVVEEKDIPAEAVEGESSFLPEPEKRDQELIEEKSEEERPEGDRQAPIQDYGEEVSPSIEGINRKAEEWSASEGVQILERVAGKILPGIAAEVRNSGVRLKGSGRKRRRCKEGWKSGWVQRGCASLGRLLRKPFPGLLVKYWVRKSARLTEKLKGCGLKKRLSRQDPSSGWVPKE